MEFSVFHYVAMFLLILYLCFINSIGKIIEFEDYQDPDGPWRRQPILIQNGGYQNILIAIHDEIEESIGLIENLKDTFTRTSKVLFEATKQSVYFKDISILVPKHWSQNSSFEKPKLNETYNTSRVIIRDDEAVAGSPNVPFVSQPGRCGEEGEFIYLPSRLWEPDNDVLFRDPAKTIAHLWGHLRWGLFDEFPVTPDDQLFFSSTRGKVEPSSCPRGLPGRLMQGNYEIDDVSLCSREENNTCEIILNANEEDKELLNRRGSMMSYYLTESVTKFCHSDPSGDVHSRHNTEAPTQQNRLCLGKSSWDVILESGDIPLSQTSKLQFLKPKFRLLQNTDVLSVVILDARVNMKDHNKFQRMVDAFKHYVYDMFPPYSLLGVVSVNGTAEKVYPCLQLWEESSFRWRMTINLPPKPFNSSSLGEGVAKAIEVLQEDREDINGSMIFIMSDGTDVITPTVADKEGDVYDAGVVLASLPFSVNTSENIALANTVHYKHTSFLENNDRRRRRYQGTTVTDQRRSIRIAKEEVNLEGNYDFQVTFDEAFGKRELLVRFKCSENEPRVFVTNEQGAVILEYFDEVEGHNCLEAATVCEDCETVTVHLNSTQRTVVTVEVFSVAFIATDFDLKDYNPVMARLLTSSTSVNVTRDRMIRIYGILSQGERQITASEVEVNVMNPEGEKTMMKLQDNNGKEPDNFEGDGIYSGYFTNFSTSGLYHVEMFACIREEGMWKRVDEGFTSGALTQRREYPLLYRFANLSPFQRVPLPILFEAFDVPKDFQLSDYLPPGTITDLRLANTVVSNYVTITLSWTAPGNDFMEGQAHGYDLRFSNTRRSLSENFDNSERVKEDTVISATINKPRLAGETEHVKVFLRSYVDSVIYFGIRAFDESENLADISNILEVGLPHVNESGKGTTCGSAIENTTHPPAGGSDLTRPVKFLIIFICLSSAVAVSIVMLWFLFKKFKSKRKVSSATLERTT